MIKSMTGFAAQSGAESPFSWSWELRSVNNKGLDVRLRLPAGMDGVEQQARNRITQRFVILTLSRVTLMLTH